jgi:hypothetical protein
LNIVFPELKFANWARSLVTGFDTWADCGLALARWIPGDADLARDNLKITLMGRKAPISEHRALNVKAPGFGFVSQPAALVLLEEDPRVPDEALTIPVLHAHFAPLQLK